MARRVAGSDISQRTASGRSPAPTLWSRVDEKYGPRCLCDIPTHVSIIINDIVPVVVAFTELHPLAYFACLSLSTVVVDFQLD